MISDASARACGVRHPHGFSWVFWVVGSLVMAKKEYIAVVAMGQDQSPQISIRRPLVPRNLGAMPGPTCLVHRAMRVIARCETLTN